MQHMIRPASYRRIARLAFALLAAALAATGIAYAAGLASLVPAADRLWPNPGFDELSLDGSAGYYNPPGVVGRVASGWNVILENGNPTFYSSCEEKGNRCGARESGRMRGGQKEAGSALPFTPRPAGVAEVSR